MNYRPYVSWGAYGATTAAKAAHLYTSWGIFDPTPFPAAIAVIGSSVYPFGLEII